MRMILRYEILKTCRRWRSYIAFAAIAVVVPLIMVAVKLQGNVVAEAFPPGSMQGALVPEDIVNGYSLTFLIMNSLWLHIPFLITLVAGDQLAGEAAGGTLRLLLSRPASRSTILFAKYMTTLLYSAAVVGFLMGLSLGLGVVLFGTGPMVVPGKLLITIPGSDALWRLCLAGGLSAWGMATVASFAFLLSSLADNALGPILGTIACMIALYVVSAIPLDLFQAMKPFLFTTYLSIWQMAGAQPIAWLEIGRSALILCGFSIGFYLVTWYIFTNKDILS
jgi:ABC-2 type transport system permease protein